MEASAGASPTSWYTKHASGSCLGGHVVTLVDCGELNGEEYGKINGFACRCSSDLQVVCLSAFPEGRRPAGAGQRSRCRVYFDVKALLAEIGAYNNF